MRLREPPLSQASSYKKQCFGPEPVTVKQELKSLAVPAAPSGNRSELIAFDVVGASSGFVRTGDYSGDGEVTATAMIDLGPGWLAHAMRVSESGHADNALAVTVFRVSDVSRRSFCRAPKERRARSAESRCRRSTIRRFSRRWGTAPGISN